MKPLTKKLLLIIGILMLMFIALDMKAQGLSDESTYKAYLSNDPLSTSWKTIVAARNEVVLKTPTVPARFHLALAQFGLLNATMRTRDEDLFDDYYKATEKNLNAILTADPNSGEASALLSAIYGLKIAYSSFQGMFLGPKSGNLVEKAIKLDESSALVWRVYANAKYFTPEMWGGDIDLAIEAYEKSIKLFEANPEGIKNNWLYLDALVFSGQAYLKKGETAKAIAVYEKALRFEPEFGWVKNVLLPRAKAKASK